MRSSQPSGSLCCGRRWHFRKPALSTDKFKLKVISRSLLYIYTLNVSCIMLVYYFVPFIVSNRYFLFWVSNGHNSVTVQNRTHVYVNFFHHKDLGNHLLQLCPKVVKHPVCMYECTSTYEYYVRRSMIHLGIALTMAAYSPLMRVFFLKFWNRFKTGVSIPQLPSCVMRLAFAFVNYMTLHVTQ